MKAFMTRIEFEKLIAWSNFLARDAQHYGQGHTDYEIVSDRGAGDAQVVVLRHPDWAGRVALTNGDPVFEAPNPIAFAAEFGTVRS